MALVLLSGFLGVGASVASGQVTELPSDEDQAALAEVELRVVRLGPGGLARRGSWAGVLVELRDRGLQQREVVLRASIEDRDGDEAWYDRVVASNPGFAQSFWVYARLPARGSGVVVTAHAAVETEVDEAAPAGLRGFEAGPVLARATVDVSRAGAATDGLLGVLGPSDFGLRQYSGGASGSTGSSPGERFSPAGHEPSRVVAGLSVPELPDRWQGLSAIEALVWGRGDGTGPSSLTADQARAVREWVVRGGHLIVVLGAAEGEWLSPADNPLYDLVPAIEPPLRREGVNLETYRALLTTEAVGTLPASAVVRSFRRATGAAGDEAMPILTGPGGDVVVMRRLVGGGAVSLVGLDLGALGLASAGLPDAEAFWHRVLGRRGPVVTGQAELIERFGEDAARAASRRDPTVFDADVDEQIDTARRAAAGVLLGFVVFGVYWLVAGPLGFWVLSRAGMRRHAWMGFAAAAVVFTAIAWIGATLIRPSSIEVQHLTLLEQVHGQPVQRARGWGSVLIPWYGRAQVAIRDDDAARELAETVGLRRWHDLLAPWAPTSGGGLVGGFPDNRGYRVEARAPSAASVPARSTVKQFRFDWAGEPRWTMPRPMGEPGDVATPVLTLRDDGAIDGVLQHGLPGSLESVVLIWVRGQTRVGPISRTAQEPMSRVLANRLVDPWPAGQRLDLLAATVTGEPAERFLADLLGSGQRLGGLGGGGPSSGPIDERLVALSVFSQLPPPDLGFEAQLGRTAMLATRSEGHGWDLGRWFTQPCLIVIGQLIQDRDEAGVVAPLTVDGGAPAASGRTVVRWVYPLPADPPEWAARAQTVAPGGLGVQP